MRPARPDSSNRDATTLGGVAVTESGHGPAVLIVHGGSGDGSAWSAVAAALPRDLRVLRYDRFTYRAGTQPSSGAETMAHEVADVLAIADALDGPLVVVGHSSGAVVTLQAARQRTFAGMVLYEPPVAVTEPLGGEALRRARAALDAGKKGEAIAIHIGDIVGMHGLARLIRVVPPVRRAMSRFAPGQIADDEALESVGVGLDQYARIRTPALLLGGAKSPAHLRERLAALAQTLPTVDDVVIIAGQGHMANEGAPQEVARIVAGFAHRVLR